MKTWKKTCGMLLLLLCLFAVLTAQAAFADNDNDAVLQELQDAISQPWNPYALSGNLTIAEGTEFDASRLRNLVVPEGVTLTVKGKLTVSALEPNCNVVIDSGGELCITESMWSETSWYDIESENWTFWQEEDSVNRITFEGDAGFTLQRGECEANAEGFKAALSEAEQALAGAPASHVRFEFGVPRAGQYQAVVLNEEITIPSGVIVDVNGWLWFGEHLTVEDGACINVGINGDRNTELCIGGFPGGFNGSLTLNGTISLYADSDSRLDPWAMDGNGSIILYDESSVPLDGYRWSEAPIDDLFQFQSENAALDLQYDVNSNEDFRRVLEYCQSLPAHTRGTINTNFSVVISEDLNAEDVAINISNFQSSGNNNVAGSLTVENGVTFTAGSLTLNNAPMTVHGKLITTDTVNLWNNNSSISFDNDACYENRGGCLAVQTGGDPYTKISGLTMDRFHVERRSEYDWVFTDTGILDFADSAALQAGIDAAYGEYRVTQNTLIAAGESVDASGVSFSVDEGVTLLVNGTLNVGNFVPSENIIVSEGGALQVTGWHDIDYATWTAWEQNGTVRGLSFADGAGLTVQRGDCVTDEESLMAVLKDAKQSLANVSEGHLRYAFGIDKIPGKPGVELTNAATIPEGVILNLNGSLSALSLTVDGETVITGNLNVSATLTVNGTVSQYGSATCRKVVGRSGGITLIDDGVFKMSKLEEAQAAIESEILQFNGSSTGILYDTSVSDAVAFESLWKICQDLDERISVRIGIRYPMVLDKDLNAASPKAIGLVFGGNLGGGSNLTVSEGATLTVSELQLFSTNMTVHGKLISTEGIRLGGGFCDVRFDNDGCYESQGTVSFYVDSYNGNQNQQITGLTMSRFNVEHEDGSYTWVYTDKGFADSAALRAAITKGEDFTVTENTVIAADEIGENAVDASGIKLSVAEGVTLLVKGKLIVGDFSPYVNLVFFDDGGVSVSCNLAVSDGGELYVTKWIHIDYATWMAFEQDGTVNGLTFADGAGFTAHLGEAANEEHFAGALGEAASAAGKVPEGLQGHVRFDVGIQGAAIDLGTEDIVIPSGVILNIWNRGTLRAGSLTVENGGLVLLGDGSTVEVSTEPKSADLVLPSALNKIESEAFADGCFDSVYIPAGTTSIAPDAFGEQHDLTVYGSLGSEAYTFAQENGFTFKAVA